MLQSSRIPLGRLLVAAKLVSEAQLGTALAEQKRWGGRLGEILVRMSYLSEDLLVKVLSEQLGYPVVDLAALPDLPRAVLDRVPRVTARRCRALPIGVRDDGRTVVVAMADPRDLKRLDELRSATGGARIVPYLAVPGPKRSAFAAVADWAQMAGAAGAACLLAYVPIASTHGMRGAMVALAASVSLPLSILMCGTNALRQLRSPPGLAASIAPHLTPNASFYCVGSFWPALTFELRRTCTVVEYRGELELELDPDRTHHIDSVETFLERWKGDSAAVAVVAPRVWDRIALSGTASRTILDEPTAIVMVKP